MGDLNQVGESSRTRVEQGGESKIQVMFGDSLKYKPLEVVADDEYGLDQVDWINKEIWSRTCRKVSGRGWRLQKAGLEKGKAKERLEYKETGLERLVEGLDPESASQLVWYTLWY